MGPESGTVKVWVNTQASFRRKFTQLRSVSNSTMREIIEDKRLLKCPMAIDQFKSNLETPRKTE